MKKTELPSKVCPVCDRPFLWRKRWRRCWDEVRYCSERCRRLARPRQAKCQRHPDHPERR
ncbi:DUF2256 domain-containing protein [Pseudomonas sp. JS3066]|uniref:DUF2256 domain-containing protein n=1 Tax=unclassified Pseudomonas TaxID=196821 RepID=UPI000EA8E7D3|nr:MULTISPECIES: DUF2256 domain-containing protein [unclassified Pseudomonas]AYF86783.1 DUF2256 domain-containing protein [Pseudomonas sp. DY-1]MDH4653686.1 DUF2256 domain-containing protein [Pseudomonas sp. BN606]MRK21967.1 DUF2256 domain-containing protein [Pseudomonas sp. JG-B]WVK95745.1 DUF2256 domain-containing protein [Pseudomonas sp. JS3066]